MLRVTLKPVTKGAVLHIPQDLLDKCGFREYAGIKTSTKGQLVIYPVHNPEVVRHITASAFTKWTGRKPEYDDLARANCQKAGKQGHKQCGWNFNVQAPVFMVGRKMRIRKFYVSPDHGIICSICITGSMDLELLEGKYAKNRKCGSCGYTNKL